MFKKIISLTLVFILCFAILPSISTAVRAEEATVSGQIKISPNSPSGKGTYSQYTGTKWKWWAVGNWGYSPKFDFFVYRGTARVYYASNTTGTFYYTFNSPGYYKVYLKVKNASGYQKESVDYFKIIANNTPLSLRPSYTNVDKYVGGTVGLKSYGAGGTAPYQYAFYVSKGAGIVYKGSYSKNNSFSYTFLSNGTYTITAFIKDAKGNRVVKKLSPFYVYPQSSSTPSPYKSLVVGEYHYGSEPLAGVQIDREKMSALFANRGPFGAMPVKKAFDIPASEIITNIRTQFANTTASSVSIFYYAGHGDSDGSLVGIDGGLLPPATLANELKKLNGKVIVILDSCHSGNYINKGASFNQSVINAFAAVNSQIKVGEMLTSKFHVITGASKHNYSYGDDTKGGYLTYGIRFAKDLDNNGFISIHEAYASGKYWAKTLSGYQTVQCYPLNDQLILYK